jgi:hypothetical protein
VPLWGPLFSLHFGRLVPTIGALVADDRQACTYLPQSVDRFVTPAELARMMEAAGLREMRRRRLGLGTITLQWGIVLAEPRLTASPSHRGRVHARRVRGGIDAGPDPGLGNDLG